MTKQSQDPVQHLILRFQLLAQIICKDFECWPNSKILGDIYLKKLSVKAINHKTSNKKEGNVVKLLITQAIRSRLNVNNYRLTHKTSNTWLSRIIALANKIKVFRWSRTQQYLKKITITILYLESIIVYNCCRYKYFNNRIILWISKIEDSSKLSSIREIGSIRYSALSYRIDRL